MTELLNIHKVHNNLLKLECFNACMGVSCLWGHQIMVRWFNLTRDSILVTYLREINNTIFNKIFSSYSTKLQYTNISQ